MSESRLTQLVNKKIKWNKHSRHYYNKHYNVDWWYTKGNIFTWLMGMILSVNKLFFIFLLNYTNLSSSKYNLWITTQPEPGTDREKFNEIKLPIWTFFVKQSFSPMISLGVGVWGTPGSGSQQSFSPMISLGVGVWGTPGSGSQVGRVIFVLRTFPEMVWRSVQNLLEIGPAARCERGT